jgi:hydroxyacyl-ACP dehydratase HTD2-like protein with hotdog domain
VRTDLCDQARYSLALAAPEPRLMRGRLRQTSLLQFSLSTRLTMFPIVRRFYSSTSATSIASQFLSKSQSLPPHTQTQILDANQLQRFSATLSRPELSQSLPESGTPLPACYHLAYFTPSQVEEELGRDGTDTTFNPPSPFTRRMWAGGELEWIGVEANRLKVGQEVRETTKLVSAVGKKTRAGEEMVIVGVEKTYENEHGVALIDKR